MVISDQENGSLGKVVGMRCFAHKIQFEHVSILDSHRPGPSRWYDEDELGRPDLISDYRRECNIQEAGRRVNFERVDEVSAYNIMGTRYFMAVIPNTGFKFRQFRVSVIPDDEIERSVYVVYGPRAEVNIFGTDINTPHTLMIEYSPERSRFRFTRSV